MSTLQTLYEELSYEEELERAKWFHNDLDRENTDWCELKKTQFGTCWLKDFLDQEVPRKVLFDVVIPVPADALKWDSGFTACKVVDELPLVYT